MTRIQKTSVVLTTPPLLLAGALLSLGWAAAPAHGASVAITNHSFETDDVSGLTNQLNADIVPTGWSGFDDGRNNATAGNARGLVYHGPGPSAVGPTLGQDDGSQSFFTAQRDILQVLTATLQADTTYTIRVDIGDRDINNAGGNPGTPIVNLGYGATPGLNNLIVMNQGNQPVQVNGAWVEWSAQFTTGSSPAGLNDVLRIDLTNGTNVGWIDNVRLDATPIPEPSSAALLASLSILLLRRKRK